MTTHPWMVLPFPVSMLSLLLRSLPSYLLASQEKVVLLEAHV